MGMMLASAGSIGNAGAGASAGAAATVSSGTIIAITITVSSVGCGGVGVSTWYVECVETTIFAYHLQIYSRAGVCGCVRGSSATSRSWSF
jgi:hypothetical protein